LAELLTLFLNNLLPNFLIAGVGFVLGNRLSINARTISQLTFYFFSPCLVFKLITQNQVSGNDVARMVSFGIAITALMGLLAWSIGRALRIERRLLVAVMMGSMFVNAANLGLPVTSFAFGETALAHASIFYVTSVMLMYTVGVLIASLGSSGLAKALLGLLKVPAVYALTLGLLIVRLDWSVPLFLERTVTMAGNAAIPSMLVLMGLQVRNIAWQGQWRAISVASGLRLLAAPLVAIGISVLFQFHGVARQAAILESSMPTAVLSMVLATEYNVEPAFVTSVVFITTILSPFTLTPLLAYLGG
jgi:predicted permease